MQEVDTIFKEHDEMNNILFEINSFIDKPFNKEKLIDLMKVFEVLWNNHERMEDKAFGKIAGFPEKMILKQHKELRGHWKVLSDALNSNNKLELEIALDTDGKMLVDKFKKHIAYEENLLESFQ